MRQSLDGPCIMIAHARRSTTGTILVHGIMNISVFSKVHLLVQFAY